MCSEFAVLFLWFPASKIFKTHFFIKFWKEFELVLNWFWEWLSVWGQLQNLTETDWQLLAPCWTPDKQSTQFWTPPPSLQLWICCYECTYFQIFCRYLEFWWWILQVSSSHVGLWTLKMTFHWLIEQCFTSPPTQYRLYGRREWPLAFKRWVSGATFSKLLRKILGRFLILGQSLTRSGKTLTRHNFTLLTNSRFNNVT